MDGKNIFKKIARALTLICNSFARLLKVILVFHLAAPPEPEKAAISAVYKLLFV